MQRSLVFILGGGVGVACGLAVGQLSAADIDLADQEIARLVVQLEDLERDNDAMAAQLERWVGGAPALPADVEIAEPIPVDVDEDGITEEAGAETGGETEAEIGAEAEAEAEGVAVNAGSTPSGTDPAKPSPASAQAASAQPAPSPGSDAPSVEDLLGALLEAEGDALTDAAPAPKPATTKAATKPAAKAATEPATKPAAAGWGSGDGPPGWPASAPRNLQPAAVNAAVRAAVSGVGELAAVDCSAFPCVVAVQAADPAEPCCAGLQQRLRAIDGYLMYAGPSQPLTVGGRATVITTWYPAGSEVDLEALSRRMDALRRGL